MVSNIRRIVKIFLASPGDLADERRTVKRVVDEFNSLWAEKSDYQVELHGWEDTASSLGRPQGIINRDLERCEYFIGIMWKRWGTPPSISGSYTSGFEEEFETSMVRQKETGSPEVSLFFKEVEDELLEDPGTDLQRVIKFRKKITENRTIYFELFGTMSDFEERIRRCVTRYVQSLMELDKEGEQSDESDIQSLEDDSPEKGNEPASHQSGEPLFTSEETIFLQDLLSKTKDDDELEPIAAVEVARFRLLANMVGRRGNDVSPLGVHDVNILFRDRHKFALSRGEKIGLIASALEHYSSENTPLWYWLNEIDAIKNYWLPLRTMFGKPEEQIGALAAMRLISEPLPSELAGGRERFIDSWLSESALVATKVAALGYLADCGRPADIPKIDSELERGNYQTKSAATEAALSISLRDSREKAIQKLNEIQPTTINNSLLARLFEDGSAISTEVLSKCVEHQHPEVRRVVVKLLSDRNELPKDAANQLISDTVAEIRYEAMQFIARNGGGFTEDEKRNILLQPKQNAHLRIGLFARRTAPDKETSEIWNRYKLQQLHEMKDSELASMEIFPTDSYRGAGFELDRRNFSVRGTALRAAVDNHFEAEFVGLNKIPNLVLNDGSGTVESQKSQDDAQRKVLTRKGLDIICIEKDPQDLVRIRTVLGSGFINYTDVDVEYLRVFGEWEDIPRIVDSLQPLERDPFSLLTPPAGDKRYQTAAQALIAVGRDRLTELLEQSLPDRLMLYLIINVTEKNFRALNDTAIALLFQSENENVRKAAALKCIRALTKGRLKELQDMYKTELRQFYNVNHWLDFGLSVPNDRTRAAATIVLDGVWKP